MKAYSTLYIVFISLSLSIFSACNGERTVFEEYQKFEKLSWNRFNILKFNASIESTAPAYDIFINIRHLPEVPYKNMLINFTIYTPSGDMRTTDYTLNFNDTDGNSRSQCMGDYCDLLLPLRESFTFGEAGVVKFEVENKFTKVEMPGILEVGLIIKEAVNN